MANRKKMRNNQIGREEGDEIAFMKSILNPIHVWFSMVVQHGIAIFTKDENIQQVYLTTNTVDFEGVME